MNQRDPISKKVRFDVFKRDGFRCQYCGQHPPAVVLEVDHINPVSNGGKGQMHNLLTSCFDCNRGKGAGLLTAIPQSVADQAAQLQEKLDQARAFDRLVKSIRRREDKQIKEVEDEFKSHFDGYSFSPKFKTSVRIFIQKLPTQQVVEAMRKACLKIGSRDDSIKYFCGICWKTIKGLA